MKIIVSILSSDREFRLDAFPHTTVCKRRLPKFTTLHCFNIVCRQHGGCNYCQYLTPCIWLSELVYYTCRWFGFKVG